MSAIGLLALAAPAWADSIPGLFNTGIDAAGNPIAGSGGTDAHYRVNGHQAITYYNGAYYGPTNSQWIGEQADGGYSQPLANGYADTTYTTTFDLTGLNPATARISGNWGVDNYGLMYLNGVQVAENNNGFGGATAFAITSGFRPGMNTLTIVVRDYGPPAAFNIQNIVGIANAKQPPAWQVGGWSAWSTTCGSASRTRPVTCISPDDGTVLDDAACTNAGAKPPTSDTSQQTSGCGYSWQTGTFGDPAPGCGATTQTRTVWCQRSDGPTVDDGLCTGTRPSTTQPATDYRTCSTQWAVGDWSAPSSTCGNGTQTRTVACHRSDGTDVDDSLCADAKPSASQTTYQTSGCGTVWETGPYGAPTPACGPTTQSRSVICRRSDGQVVGDQECAGQKPPTTQGTTDVSTCGFSWVVGAWTTPSACGTTTMTRDVACRRDDGAQVSDASCAGQRPPSSQTVEDLSGCGYAWIQVSQNEWSICSNGTQSRTGTVVCRRSDGQTAAEALCTSAKPDTYETRSCQTGPTGPTTPVEGDVVIFRRPVAPPKK